MASQLCLNSRFNTIELEIIRSVIELVEEVRLLNGAIDSAEVENKILHIEIEEIIKRAESSV